MPGEARSRLMEHHPVKPTHYPRQREQGAGDKPEGASLTWNKTPAHQKCQRGCKAGEDSALGVLQSALQIMG